VQYLRKGEKDVRIRRIGSTNNQAHPEGPPREASGSRNHEEDHQTRSTLIEGRFTRGTTAEEVQAASVKCQDQGRIQGSERNQPQPHVFSMRRMSRHLPDKNRTESTHADAPERDEDHAKVDTFSNHNHQRRRGHVQGRNRNQPHLLPLRRVSEGLYRKGRETQTHAHSRLKATIHLKDTIIKSQSNLQRHEAQLTTFRQQKRQVRK